MPSQKRGILERLNSGEVIVGDGGYVLALEKRGYVKAGPWTPEAAVEYPDAVRQLHREFLRAGADVLQALTFYANEDKLDNRGHGAASKHTCQKINEAACDLAKEVAKEGNNDVLVLGSLNQTPTYMNNLGKDRVQAEFQKQIDVFVQKDVDFLLCELFHYAEEMEWAIEVCKKTGKPVAALMCINKDGDLHDVPAAECAVRMVRAGADIIGVNCHFDPTTSLQTIKEMKRGLEAAGLKAHLMSQPLAYHTPDVNKGGFANLPEFPFALEPRVCSRFDIHKYAREAYALGVRYIGGCCGFEPYHVRAIAEELAAERGNKAIPGADKHEPWGAALRYHTLPWVRAKASRDYWETLKPATGRPDCPSVTAGAANWGVVAGHEELKQHRQLTSEEEQRHVCQEMLVQQKLSKIIRT